MSFASARLDRAAARSKVVIGSDRTIKSEELRSDYSVRIILIELSGLLCMNCSARVSLKVGASARARETESGIRLDAAAMVIPKPRNSINAFAGNASVSVQVQSSLATTDNFDAW